MKLSILFVAVGVAAVAAGAYLLHPAAALIVAGVTAAAYGLMRDT